MQGNTFTCPSTQDKAYLNLTSCSQPGSGGHTAGTSQGSVFLPLPQATCMACTHEDTQGYGKYLICCHACMRGSRSRRLCAAPSLPGSDAIEVVLSQRRRRAWLRLCSVFKAAALATWLKPPACFVSHMFHAAQVRSWDNQGRLAVRELHSLCLTIKRRCFYHHVHA